MFLKTVLANDDEDIINKWLLQAQNIILRRLSFT